MFREYFLRAVPDVAHCLQELLPREDEFVFRRQLEAKLRPYQLVWGLPEVQNISNKNQQQFLHL
tara:strand:- start:578 stop:769 length:192 start_codon:yes stop_codon:yes gene_type:complete